MFEDEITPPNKPPADPTVRAREKVEEFRMHAELAAVFEGPRKFSAELLPDLPHALAKDIQLAIAKLDKARANTGQLVPPPDPANPLSPEPVAEALRLLTLPTTAHLSTNDYHLSRRPGEVLIARFLSSDEVDTFFSRLQAHFDAALDGHKEDERQENQWRNDPASAAYLAELEKISLNLPEIYIRPHVAKHGLFALNTQTADEVNIAYLADYIMNITPADLVGEDNAPPDAPTDQDLAWYFKLFLLRGYHKKTELALFFAFLQKTDDAW